MRNMLRYFVCAVALIFIESSCFASPPPASVASSLRNLETFFAERLSTTSRVQLMIIAPGVFLDPPATASNFPKIANITIAVDGPTAYELTKLIVANLRSSKWREAPAPGYPRWYWRVVDASGVVVIDLLIDEENSAICHADAWYVVDRKLVNRLTHGFVDFAAKQMLLPPDQRPDLNNSGNQ